MKLNLNFYNSNEEKTIINQDFETMTKGSYKIDIKNESGIDYILDETLLTKTVNDSKNDLASAKLRENGILTIDYVIEDFNSLSFYFGKIKTLIIQVLILNIKLLIQKNGLS